ncbi:MAG: ubiquitin-conjugating enzyme E2 [Candidatus Caldarchaeum sp.]
MENVYAELPESAWHRRLALEYSLIQENEPTFSPVENDLTHYEGVIIGTNMYEGGYFKVEILIPRSYPYFPPDILWHTRIWHPNFSDTVPARVCESVFKDHWSPSLRIVAVIEALRNLLNNPNPEDPLNPVAAFEYKHRPDLFMARVRQFLEVYASPEEAFKLSRRKGL